MYSELKEWFEEEYDEEVKYIYQIGPCLYVITTVNGEDYYINA